MLGVIQCWVSQARPLALPASAHTSAGSENKLDMKSGLSGSRGQVDMEVPCSFPHRVCLQLPGHSAGGLRGLGQLPLCGGHGAVPVPPQRGGADV